MFAAPKGRCPPAPASEPGVPSIVRVMFMASDRIGDSADWNPRPSPAPVPSPGPRPGSTSWRRPRSRGPPDAGAGRQHAQGRPDRLPLAPHVGPARAGGDDARRVHGGRGAGLEPVEPHHRRRVVRRRDVHPRRGQARPRLRSRFGPGDPLPRRHPPGTDDPRDRIVRCRRGRRESASRRRCSRARGSARRPGSGSLPCSSPGSGTGAFSSRASAASGGRSW